MVVALAVFACAPAYAGDGVDRTPSVDAAAPSPVDAAGDASAATADDAAEERSTRLIWQWERDKGIRYRLELPFESDWLGPETGPLLGQPFEKRLAFIGTIGARLQVDAAGYATTRGLDDVDGDVELRRLRFGTRGDFYFLRHVSYALDLEVIGPNSVEVGDVYLWWSEVPFLQRLKIGNFVPPMSLESLTSNRDIPFMETALPVQALAPARSSGVQVGGPVLGERVTWALAFVRTIATTDQGDKSKAGGRVVGRVTWLPQDDPGNARLTHVGLGLAVLAAAEDVQFKTRPESHLAPSLVDTGALHADDQSTVYGLEGLHVDGPWLVMGEAIGAGVTGTRSANFWGLYALVMRTLTGETQPYDRSAGILGRFVPARPFSWRDGTYGAFRAGARVSHIDLSDGPVAGGRETDLTADLTWVLNPYLLVKLEYGLALVRDRPNDGNLHFVQTRVQLDFY